MLVEDAIKSDIYDYFLKNNLKDTNENENRSNKKCMDKNGFYRKTI